MTSSVGTGTLRIPHPEKVLFPELGITRRALVEYYLAVAQAMVPHLKDRAITVIRWPHGIHGQAFYQKHPNLPGSPPQADIVIDDTEQLLKWVALGAIEFHVPLGTLADPLVHDWAVMDLDPNPPAGWPEVVEVFEAVHWILDRIAVPFLLKTSGATGLHLYIAIRPVPHQVATAAMEWVARTAADALPDVSTVERRVKLRGPKVYLDYLQNGHARTMAGVYSVRANPEALASCPISPQEVREGPLRWTMNAVLDRVANPTAPRWRWPGPPVDLRERFQSLGLTLPRA